MAITKMMHMKTAKKGSPGSHIKNAIDYILKEEKVAQVDGIRLAGTNACMLSGAYNSMLHTKELYGKTDGRQGYHFVISFKPGQASVGQVYKLTQAFVSEYLSEYECVYAVHDDQPHKHGHIVFNSVSYQTGLKYHYANGDWEKIIQPIVDRLCIENGLPPLEYHVDIYENDKNTKEYYHYTRNFNWKEENKADIDECIAHSKDWQDFVAQMKEKGYIFNFKKYVTIRKPGMKINRRLTARQMGFDYTPEGIIARIKIKTGEFKISDVTPHLPTGTVKLPERQRIKHTFKKYADMSFREKTLVKHMLRLRHAIPEYKIYPGAWYSDRKLRELNRVCQELILVKQFRLQDMPDISAALKELAGREKALREGKNRQEFLKKEWKELIESYECMEKYENEGNKTGTEDTRITPEEYKKAEERIIASGETRDTIRNFLNDCNKNDETFQSELKNIKKQKAAISRLRKKYGDTAETTNRISQAQKQEVKRNGDKRIT